MNINVQFSDETESVITALFGGPQSSDDFDFLGEVDANDARYIVFYDALPELFRRSLPEPITSGK
ncbi:hypothetical protein [Yersinia aldovae]|uniref:hypothetical protein n=1 Tax=Yersinia aldovae TaxID=29483 RepID=UPI0011AA4347|nr:hypothetical protein [Yersinia aldovae]